MIKEYKGFTPEQLLSIIEFDNMPMKDYTFIIFGNSGPTGKSWLTKELNSRGYTAFELSEDIRQWLWKWLWAWFENNDDENHCIINSFDKQVIIILNKPLSNVRRIDNGKDQSNL